jgi:hypothetical protein
MSQIIHINQYLDSPRLELRDLATPLWVLPVLDSVLLVLSQLVGPEARHFVRRDADLVVGLCVGDSGESDGSDGESRGVVESQHGPRGGGRSFLDITEDVELVISTYPSRILSRWDRYSPSIVRPLSVGRRGDR